MVRYSGVVIPKMSTAARSRSWTMPVKSTPTRISLGILATCYIYLGSESFLSEYRVKVIHLRWIVEALQFILYIDKLRPEASNRDGTASRALDKTVFILFKERSDGRGKPR